MTGQEQAQSLNTATNRVDHTVVMVDAAIAARWLQRNTNNRTIRRAIVTRYQSDMIAGRWLFAGDAIRFDTDGNMIDGQHRCTALAGLEGITLPMLVIRGLPSAAQSVIDQGAKRTPGDQLGLIGVKNANGVAASVKQFILWDEGLLFRDSRLAQTVITSARIKEWVDGNPEDLARFQEIRGLTLGNDAPPAVAGAASIAFCRINHAESIKFFSLLTHGAGTEGNPIVTLDKRLQRMRREGLKMPARDYLALFILAWNACRTGRQTGKFLRPAGKSWSPENFPVPM